MSMKTMNANTYGGFCDTYNEVLAELLSGDDAAWDLVIALSPPDCEEYADIYTEDPGAAKEKIRENLRRFLVERGFVTA